MRNPDTRATLLAISALLLLWLAGCGSPSTGPTVSGLTKRALVSDDFDGSLHIVDAQLDQESASRISTSQRPGPMVVSADRKLTLVFGLVGNVVNVVDNSTETVTGSIFLPDTMPDFNDSFVVLPDDKTGFASVRSSNLVEVLDLSAFNITGGVPVSLPRRMVLSHDGTKLLVFSDNSDSVTVIDTAAATTTPATAATSISSPGFSRPTFAVFSANDSEAFILSCGPECGGAAAAVTAVNMTTNPPTPGTTVAVPAATIALLGGTSLYVAGTIPAAGATPAAGKLVVLNTSSLAVPANSVNISDGLHDRMELAGNGQLFIGARNCTDLASVPHSGCLTIFTPSTNTAIVDEARGDVTGIAPITGRNVVYVIEGGELVIYDTTTDAPQATQVDVVGTAVDVKLIDP